MAQPKLTRAPQVRFDLAGHTADYLAGVIDQWLMIAPDSNPAMLEMFHDRDRLPQRQMVPWAGEFAGKYLTSAVQVLRLTQDPALCHQIQKFVDALVELQAADGYLGPWSRGDRLTNSAANARWGSTWDTWGHYHITLGLLMWHEESDDRRALACAVGIADLLCEKYMQKKRSPKRPRLVDTGNTEMNLAVVHSLALLYRRLVSRIRG